MKLFAFILLISSALWGQNNKINYVEVEYFHSMERHPVRIVIDSPIDKSLPITLKTTIKKKSAQTVISNESFNKICTGILSLTPKEIVSNFSDGGDGALTTLKFGDHTNEISYRAWGLYKNDSYGSPELVRVIQIILEIAKVKIDDLN